MKSAKDWAEEYHKQPGDDVFDFVAFIERIQSDAVRDVRRTCHWQGCMEDAVAEVLIVMKPPLAMKADPKGAIKLASGILACESHRAVATVEDYVDDKLWEKLAEMVQKSGCVRPSKKRTEIDFLALKPVCLKNCIHDEGHDGDCATASAKSNEVRS